MYISIILCDELGASKEHEKEKKKSMKWVFMNTNTAVLLPL